MESHLLGALRRERLLAVVRSHDAAAAQVAIVALVMAGLRVIEVSLTTPDAFAAVVRARQTLAGADVPGPRPVFGVGGVRTEAEATRAADLDLFVATPSVTAGAREAVRLSVPLLCGAWTEAELGAAGQAGADAVRLFPADQGGPPYLIELLEGRPGVPVVTVGGIEPETVQHYLAAGAVAVGAGASLLGDAASGGGDLGALRRRARAFLDALRIDLTASDPVSRRRVGRRLI